MELGQPKEFSAEKQKQVDQWTEKSAAKDVEILTHIAKIQAPLWEERSKVLKDVEGFWPDALFNCLPFVIYMIGEDRPLLKHITDIRVLRDLNEIRNLRLEFDFSDNAYFSDKTLVKEFVAKKDAPQIGEEFDWVEHLIAKKTTINWKSEDKNLAKKHPSQTADEDGEFGSLFASFFENDKGDPAPAIGEIIAFTFFPNAIDYYTGKTSDIDDEDFEEYSEDEEDEDDDREIDLEEEEARPKKKTKN